MKHISEVSSKAQKAITHGYVRPCKDKSPANDKLIGRLFAVMAVKYAHKWTSNFPDEIMLEAAKREWSKELGHFSTQHIAYAVDNVIDEYPEWPPTIGQFKQLCKAGEVEPLYTSPKLPNPSTPETAICELEKMKRLLRHA